MNRYILLPFVITAILIIASLMWLRRIGGRPPVREVRAIGFLGRWDPMIGGEAVRALVPRGSHPDQQPPVYLTLGSSEFLNSDFFRVLGIGPSSSVSDDYGPMSLVKHASSSGQLIVNDIGGQYFNSSCDPDSVLRIPFEFSDTWGVFVIPNVTYQLLLHPTHQEMDEDVSIEVHHRSAVFGTPSELLHLPSPLYEEIVDIFFESGARSAGRIRFSDCYRESLIARLPPILLTFSPYHDQLVLYPDDYVRFDDATLFCNLLIDGIEVFESPRDFNPLSIPDVNVHIAHDHILLCDSLFAEQGM